MLNWEISMFGDKRNTLKSVIYSAMGIPTISDSGFGSHPLCYIISLEDSKMLEKNLYTWELEEN